MGRTPKPKALKELAGTFRSDRHAPDAPEFPPGVPEPPEGFEDAPWGETAISEYWRLGTWLRDAGLLSVVDRAAYLGYCDSWGQWMYYRGLVAENGNTTLTSKGSEVISTDAIMMQRALDNMKGFLRLFGLSPADRTRVSTMGEKNQKRNAFEEFRSA